MNKYTLKIKTTFNNEPDYWRFIIFSDETIEYVTSVISSISAKINFESPVDLMDYVCENYHWKWEDFEYDIEIEVG